MAIREIGAGQRRRIVITGMGVITAPSQRLDQFWNCIRHGISGGKAMTRFPAGAAPTRPRASLRRGRSRPSADLAPIRQLRCAPSKLGGDHIDVRGREHDPRRVPPARADHQHRSGWPYTRQN